MALSEKDKQNFIKMVCPGYRRVAKDLINEKIDALYIRYDFVSADYIKSYDGMLGDAYIEIFENSTDEPSKVIMLHANRDHISPDDLLTIRHVVNFYGGPVDYNVLTKSDRDEKLRWQLLKLYADDPEACSVIMTRKLKKIYDDLSDSDKLLLEITDYDIGDYRL